MNLQQDTPGDLLEWPLVTIGSGALTSQSLRVARSQQIHIYPSSMAARLWRER